METVEQDRALVSVEQAAHVTGMSQSWWRGEIRGQRVPVVRLGRRVLIPRAALDALIEGGRIEPRGLGMGNRYERR